MSTDYKKLTKDLLPVLREDVNELVEAIAAIIPNDYIFSLLFDPSGVALIVQFEDGCVSTDAGGYVFTSRKSMMRKIRGVDWEAKRLGLIHEGGILEQLTSEAEDRPVNIPSSREAAERYATELASIFDEFKNAKTHVPFAMAFTREGDGIIDVQDYSTRSNVIGDMSAKMTLGYDILAVFENGAAWSFDDIEAVKLEAVRLLGPISRAKAERRFMLT